MAPILSPRGCCAPPLNASSLGDPVWLFPKQPHALSRRRRQRAVRTCAHHLFYGRRLLLNATVPFLLSKPVEALAGTNGIAMDSPRSAATPAPNSSFGPSASTSSGLVDTDSWYRFLGEGFAVSVPPDFEDVMEAEDYSAGSSLYGKRARAKTFACRFTSSDRSEVLSVVIRPASQLRLSFFEASDITDLGSLREAASVFLPAGAKVYSARTIKSDKSSRTYYYYEFSSQDRHVAMEAAALSGKVFVVGATAPQSKWKDEGKKLRSAAVSFSLVNRRDEY